MSTVSFSVESIKIQVYGIVGLSVRYYNALAFNQR